jgi:hypothetical protein
VVDCARLRAVGWRPAYDNAVAFEVLLAQRSGAAVAGRRLDRKDAAITAAGATAAAIGAAVIIARARRHRP